MFRYAATIFVSAFLLFQVQPMVARFILPWFGGSSLVWTTCMLFFQMALVGGYAYSHFISSKLSPRTQWYLHTILLVVAIMFLPVKPNDYWKPDTAEMPSFRILLLLAASVGLPFFLLSTTGPLIQAWQSKTHPSKSPFRLFALSNAASLAALISYPFVFERFFSTKNQSLFWSVGFCLFAVLAITSGRMFSKFKGLDQSDGPDSPTAESEIPKKNLSSEKIGSFRFALWLILPMLASTQLLATTNLMTQEIGSLPFLWIVPLSLYLVSFILCFDHDWWYIRPFWFNLFFLASIYSALVLEAGVEAPIVIQVIGYSVICFGASMCCHGELSRIKPSPEHLTLFYLMISIGGALGGIFVALIAPLVFDGYYEFPLSLILAIVFCLVTYGFSVVTTTKKLDVTANDESNDGKSKGKRSAFALPMYAVTLFVGLLTAFFVCTSFVTLWIDDHKAEVLSHTRNEYGTLTVTEVDDSDEPHRKLNNGRIEHGFQLKAPENQMLPTSYYGPGSGLGLAIDFLRWEREEATLPGQEVDASLDFGAIGLGVGTICGWCESKDRLRFFEINPAVYEIAQKYFTYLSSCPVSPEVVLGDARLQLEREVERNDPMLYDVLIADAFSSDSIPMHLLTIESMRIYKQRLQRQGILAIHVSNRYLYLENIVKVLAEELGMQAVVVDDDPADYDRYNSSTWVLVTENQGFIDYIREEIELGNLEGLWPEAKYTARWTDDFASIIPVLRWEEESTWMKDLLTEKGWSKEEDDDGDVDFGDVDEE